jgi:uncharacterized membrane protein
MKIKYSLLLVPLFFTGCYWENEETLFPESMGCDTTAVTFSGDVLPVMTDHCFTCHSNLNAPEFAYGITLEDYEDIAASAQLILGAISHQQGYPPMPKGKEQLDSCTILTFEAWVKAGSPDN